MLRQKQNKIYPFVGTRKKRKEEQVFVAEGT